MSLLLIQERSVIGLLVVRQPIVGAAPALQQNVCTTVRDTYVAAVGMAE